MYVWNKQYKMFYLFYGKEKQYNDQRGKTNTGYWRGKSTRLHRTKEKNREIISKGKEEKWEGQTKAAHQKNGFAIAQQNPGDKMKGFQVWINIKTPQGSP